ncbi:hypothetical protein B0H63DRAFT_506809 [Podospora didyma]|uniref:Uncharacterized protein n=1 Tax=Podospora didyma TaxID=330526 RepID=A0AAE0NWP2_9PEZI|nr:hypothetical protein B0H63DRAFT_506809 [Podospora didyma]
MVPSDLSNFRLACKAFDVAAIPFALPELIFYLQYEDLEVVRCIAAHPGKPRYVRSLFYASIILLKMFPFQRGVGNLARSYTAYEKTWTEQKKLISNKLDFAYLAEVLPRLPNLDNVTISDGSGGAWPLSFRGGKAVTPFDNTLMTAGPHLYPRCVRAVDAIVEALQRNLNPEAKKIRAFHAGNSNYIWIDHLAPNMDIFSNLTELELEFNGYRVEDEANFKNVLKGGRLSRLLEPFRFSSLFDLIALVENHRETLAMVDFCECHFLDRDNSRESWLDAYLEMKQLAPRMTLSMDDHPISDLEQKLEESDSEEDEYDSSNEVVEVDKYH